VFVKEFGDQSVNQTVIHLVKSVTCALMTYNLHFEDFKTCMAWFPDIYSADITMCVLI